jgi:hypothetical protein
MKPFMGIRKYIPLKHFALNLYSLSGNKRFNFLLFLPINTSEKRIQSEGESEEYPKLIENSLKKRNGFRKKNSPPLIMLGRSQKKQPVINNAWAFSKKNSPSLIMLGRSQKKTARH